jgi:hypothetical protein
MGVAWSVTGTLLAGIVVVVANFAVHGWSLARASRISISAVHAVALGGVVLRLGAIVAAMFAFDTTAWFSPLAFGIAVVPGTLALLAYEAALTLDGRLGGQLDIPPDETAVEAAERLATREASA